MNTPAFKFPSLMSPTLAVELGHCISGFGRNTAIVRYLALTYLFASWRFESESSPSEMELALRSIPSNDTVELLALLADFAVYADIGAAREVPSAQLQELEGFIAEVCAQLKAKRINLQKMHIKAVRFSEYTAQMLTSPTTEGALLNRALRQCVRESFGTEGEPQSTVQDFETATKELSEILRQRTLPSSAVQYDSLASGAIPVFCPLDASAIVRNLTSGAQNGTPEVNGSYLRILEGMARDSGYRGLVEVPPGNPLSELRAKFPNFHKVIDLIEDSLAAAGCGSQGSPVLLPPLLLSGPPGTGKTHFAQELARLLGLPSVERDLSVTADSLVLTGMDASFKNSKPGIVFDSIINGRVANPLIALHEVDKTSSSDQGGEHRSPLSALYQLLEPASSSRFIDEHIPIKIDASKVVWVLTANSTALPAPILSRLEVFAIRPPTKAEGRVIARYVWRELCNSYLPVGHPFSLTLSDSVLDYLSTLPPREMRRGLCRAAGAAARRRDYRIEVSSLLQQAHSSSVSRGMGFLSA